MKEFLVVDGYNIIHAWPEFEKLRDARLEHARSKLVSVLANYSPLSGQKIFVVFDAHQVKNYAEKTEIVDGIAVIYTRQGETADAFIERLVGDLLKEGPVYVATSDWAEQSVVFGRGAYRLTPEELRRQVNRTRIEHEKHCKQDTPADGYLENRLLDRVRSKFEKWRRGKK
ncbi:MAG: NYN domain-containing protein [Pelotomaculum sp.]|uniref:Predicted RNA binding protein n=1 Tax=Pelotomaculum thermopropionicum (strain DSM 13744 / JCM 10971 / SI) TaxID=370438 RepID=A5D5J8_PELTS|nr:NYN domain-containing protein [Pelotomaculum sp.]BAF58481.1 predicted RNA binding protein [Pelotomaculum thermopropionicum SI]